MYANSKSIKKQALVCNTMICKIKVLGLKVINIRLDNGINKIKLALKIISLFLVMNKL